MSMRPALLLLPLALLGCSPSEPGRPTDEPDPAPSFTPPPGAVIQIGPGEYLSEPVYVLDQEIDRWVPTVAMIEPQETRRSHRRKALTNINLNTAIAAALFPEEREAARAEVASLRELLVADRPLPEGAPPITRVSGNGLDLQIVLWGAAIELPIGEWSDLIEVRGGFAVVRRLSEEPPGGWRGYHEVAIDAVLLNFVPPETFDDIVNDARPKLGVVPLEPEGWSGILPAYFEYE